MEMGDLGWPGTAVILNFFCISHDFTDMGGNNSWTTHSICVKLLHKHDKLTQCCRVFTLALARLSCMVSSWLLTGTVELSHGLRSLTGRDAWLWLVYQTSYTTTDRQVEWFCGLCLDDWLKNSETRKGQGTFVYRKYDNPFVFRMSLWQPGTVHVGILQKLQCRKLTSEHIDI